MRRIVTTFFLMILTAPPAIGAVPLASTQPDLPAGAVAMLGTHAFTSAYSFFNASFSPDGERIATSNLFGPVIVWDAATGDRLLQIDGPDQPARTAGLRLDVKRHRMLNALDVSFLGADQLVVAWQSRSILVHDAKNGRVVFRRDFQQAIRRVLGNADGSRFVILFETAPAELWDGKNFQLVATLAPISNEEAYPTRTGVSFTADGKTLLTISADQTVNLWDAITGAKRTLAKISAGHGVTASISPDGKTIVTVADTPRLWDVESGKERLPPPRIESRPREGFIFQPGPASFSPDNQHLAIGGNAICLFDIKRNAALAMIDASAVGVVWSPDGNRLATMHNLNSLEVWDVSDLSNPKPLARSREVAGGTSLSYPPRGIEAMTLVGDARELITADLFGNLARWEIKTGELLASRPSTRKKPSPGIVQLVRSGIDAAVTLDVDGTISIFKSDSLGTLSDDDLAPRGYNRMRLLGKDGNIVAVQGRDNREVRVLNRATHAEICKIPDDGRMVGAISLSPDEKRIAIAMSNVIRVYDLPAGTQCFSIETPNRTSYATTYSPDGSTLFASFMGTHAYNAHDGKVLWETPKVWPGAMACSADGALFAGAGEEDPDTIILDAASGEVITRLTGGHEGGVTQLAFLPDSRRVISASSDTTAIVWDIRSRLLAEAKDRFGENPPTDQLWEALADNDAAKAWPAAALLSMKPAAVLPLIDASLHIDEQFAHFVDLIHRLGDIDPDAREKAHHELERAGQAAAPAIRIALQNPPDGEAGERLKSIAHLLDLDEHINPGEPSPALQRRRRARMVLRWIATPEAQAILDRSNPTAAPATIPSK